MNRRTTLKAFAAFAMAGMFSSGVHAQKGGGGSTPAGTIYYSDYTNVLNANLGLWMETFIGTYSMKADGNSKLLRSPNFARGGEPSRQIHGARWILRAEFSADTSHLSNGTPRAEMFATREDTGAKVTLTSDPNIQGYGWGLRWAFDDSFVSFAAIDWTFLGTSGGNYIDSFGNHWLAEAKVYRAAIDWSSGAPFAATPVAMFSAGLYYETVQAGIDFYVRPDVVALDWSPAGTQLAYEQITQDSPGGREYHNLRITTFASGVPIGTVQLGIGYGPEWGPLGSRIAFSTNVSTTSSNLSIWTVNPDASGRFRVTDSYDVRPKWSPDQAQIAFTRYKQSNQKGLTTWLKDVFRVAATGGTATNLTGDLSDNAYCAAWR